MSEAGQIVCTLYLCILSAIDIRIRRLPLWLLAAGGAAAVSIHIYQGEMPVILVLAGAGTGIVFLAVSRATEEGFGYGDSLLILVLGIYLGFWSLLGLLLIAFTLAAIYAAAIFIFHRLDRRTGYPFVPFLMAAYVVWICTGGF